MMQGWHSHVWSTDNNDRMRNSAVGHRNVFFAKNKKKWTIRANDLYLLEGRKKWWKCHYNEWAQYIFKYFDLDAVVLSVTRPIAWISKLFKIYLSIISPNWQSAIVASSGAFTASFSMSKWILSRGLTGSMSRTVGDWGLIELTRW